MAEFKNIENVRFRQLYDTSNNWISNNPSILPGEFVVVSDLKRLKIGTGDPFNNTEYFVQMNKYNKNADQIDDSNIKPEGYSGRSTEDYIHIFGDIVYPITTVEAVKLTDGTSLTGIVNKVNTLYNKTLLESKKLPDTCDLNNMFTSGFYYAIGGNTIINKPYDIETFGLHIYNTSMGNITQDLITGNKQTGRRFTRQYVNNVWSDWAALPTFTSNPTSGQVLVSDGSLGGIKSSGYTIAKSVPSNAIFTDTVYTHPTSGITAGTYKSVTVNTQGHVTSGTNPTTLDGYGITDAASSDHTHSYAGSSTPGGAANAAVVLATPRTINGTSFNGGGNITTANWGTSRTVALAGDVSGSASVNGGSDVTIDVTVADDSHNHTAATLPTATSSIKGVTTLTNSTSSTSTVTAATPSSVKTAYDKAVTVGNDLLSEVSRATTAEASIIQTINTNKPVWDDKYTKNEIDNKFSTLETNIDWKESVATYSALATTYPNPQDGWTVNVKDTDYTYRWSGTAWIAISANAIPKATQSVDGLLSKEDKTSYDDANVKKHVHDNKSVLDGITSSLVTAWNSAVTHISDAVKHITSTERTNWNDANSKKHTHSNKSILDGITQTLVDRWNAAHTHVSDTVKHVTAEERTSWNAVSDKVDTVPGKSLSTNDYTNAEKSKLAGIAAGAEVNVQADWNVTDSASAAYLKNKPTSLPASDVSAWAKAASKPSYGWSEISGKPSSFTPAAHTHTKSQITDMPTKVSAFENDAGYVTAADIDTSQNHAHANKSVLDTITQALLNNWNAAYTHVSNKSNPHGVTAAQVGALESLQLSNSDNLDEIKIPGFYFAGGNNSVIGKPSGTDAFGLQVYKTASGYVTQDLIAGTGNQYKRFTRQLTDSANNTWSSWTPLPTFTTTPASGQVLISDGVLGGIKSSGFTIGKSVPSNAAFTDTVYSHPNSGVTAGTYKSVTVNAQGHVTGGTNPTTLGGYGITDAAPLNHHHSEYESRGAIFTVTTSDWSSTAPYSKTILVSGVKSTDEPGLYPYTPKTLTPAQIDQGREMFKCVTDAETSEGAITLYCGKKKPTSEFQILALGISI